MNPREAAEESAAYWTAPNEAAGRNACGSVQGAANAPSGESHCIGQATGWLEQLIERGYLNAAWKQVKRNKGAAGVDGLDLEHTVALIRSEWDKNQDAPAGRSRSTRAGATRRAPQPIGGVRRLGVPKILDRFQERG